jgi:hypothetical protein
MLYLEAIVLQLVQLEQFDDLGLASLKYFLFGQDLLVSVHR